MTAHWILEGFLLQEIFPTQDQTCFSCVPCIGGRVLYHSPTWEAHECMPLYIKLSTTGFTVVFVF